MFFIVLDLSLTRGAAAPHLLYNQGNVRLPDTFICELKKGASCDSLHP